MEKHPILYEYYSKYSGGVILNRVVTSIPKLLRSATSRLSSDSKEFIKDTGKVVKNELRDHIRDNIATELFQGNNPYDSFMKNINSRIRNSDEYLYNQMYNKPVNKSIFQELNPNTTFVNYNKLSQRDDKDYLQTDNEDEDEDEDEDENERPIEMQNEYMG
jgi:predicted AAA+ superfamily ATPase